jgi:dipeptidyl aminopeptidase/acylaminoacyl peptidase
VGRLSEPRLSPDGRQVIVRVAGGTADGAVAHLWLVDIAGNAFRQLTRGPKGDKEGEGSADWAPDGKSVLFLAKRGDHTQLFRLPMDGGEAIPFEIMVDPVPAADEPVSADPAAKAKPMEADVSSWSLSPDGKTLALLIKPPETEGAKKLEGDKSDANWVGHATRWTNLYLLTLASGNVVRVPLAQEVNSTSWSRQSDRLAVVTSPPNDLSDLGPASQAWVVRTADPAHPERLASVPPTVDSVFWSNDGGHLVFFAQARIDAPPGYDDLYDLDLATGAARDLTDGFPGTVVPGSAIMEPSGDSCLVELGRGVTVTAGRVRMAKGTIEPLGLAAPVSSSLGTNARRDGWVYLGSASDRPAALYYTPAIAQPARILPTPEIRPARWVSAATERIQWQSDGVSIEGLLSLPPAARRGKVPLIVEVHGGPTSAFADGWEPFVDFLVAQGWAVLRPNPRGSTNYGASFAAAVKDDLGGCDFRDIMAGVDAVLGRFPIDAGRLALVGYSYGGEMAGFVEGKTTRFRAIVSGAPVIDQFSEYGTEDDSWYDRWYFGKPWERPAQALRQSPLTLVSHAATPFLLLQGEADATDPLGQSQEMYRALRQVGVPVELVQYPREDHGPLSGGIFGGPSPEPWHGFDARARIVGFIGRAFSGDKAPGASRSP